MSTTLYIAAIGLTVFIMAAAPFFSKRSSSQTANISSYYTEWEQEREFVFSQLSDLEYDYRMAKVSEKDYQETKADLTAKAASYMSYGKEDIEAAQKEVDREIDEYMRKNSGIRTKDGQS